MTIHKSGRMLAVTSIGMVLLAGDKGHTASDTEVPVVTKPAVPEQAQVGDPAASLEGLEFVKGAPVGIEGGKIYLVEFWATWCGPCVKNIPHLTKIQAKYRDQGVTVIGISGESDVEKVKGFVSKQGRRMDYTVAVDAARKVHAGYMRAYKRRGIPSAFLVDQKGRVVWVGHPRHGMDEVLEMLVAGTFDLETYTKEQEEKRALAKAAGEITREYFKARRDGASIEESRKIAERLFKLKSPDVLVGLAWDIFESEDSDKIQRDYELALKAARQANADTGERDPSIMDTYAEALAKTGRLKEAVEIGKKALSLETDNEEMRKYLQKQLAGYQKKLAESD